MSEKKHSIQINENGQLSFGEISKTLSDLPSLNAPKWEMVENQDQLEKVAIKLKNLKVIGVDIETTGLDPHVDQVRLLQISSSSDFVYIFDMRKIKSLSKLKQLFIAKKPVKVIHNAIFEQKFLKYQYGLDFGSIYDTMLANKLIYNGLSRRNALQDLVKDELGLFIDKSLQVSMWESEKLNEMQLEYAAKDAAVLLTIRELQIKKITKLGLIDIAKIEFDCTKATAEMEYNGMAIDNKALEEERVKLETLLSKLRDDLIEYFGYININSHQQVAKALSHKGIYADSTSEKDLKVYIDKYPEIKTFIDYKSISKIYSSTIESLQKNIHPKTNRVHSSYNQFGAASGRMSCYNPNLQNVPRGDIRRIFRAPVGRKLIIADYSQIELRIIAQISKDETLIKAFRDYKDIHSITASVITKKDINVITKDDRQKAKAVNFGLVYGMGARGLVKYASNSFNVEMTQVEAEEIYHTFFKNYSGIKNWHEKVKSTSDNIDYIETLSGRKRFYQDDKRYYSELFNTPVQGTGADILKLALTYLFEKFTNTDVKLVNCVHDEIIVECDEEMVEDIAGIVEAEMIRAGKRYVSLVPVLVDTVIADNWAGK
jgi:DNA polymerase I-like protein with 3'-5' exonuclease and polymerase domains